MTLEQYGEWCTTALLHRRTTTLSVCLSLCCLLLVASLNLRSVPWRLTEPEGQSGADKTGRTVWYRGED